MKPVLVWGLIAGAGAAVEAWALRTKRDEYTLSAVTRKLVRAEHPLGQAIFGVGITYGSHWFHHHILR